MNTHSHNSTEHASELWNDFGMLANVEDAASVLVKWCALHGQSLVAREKMDILAEHEYPG